MNSYKDREEYNSRFFKYLDTPMMIFIFESDEFVIGMLIYIFSLLFGALTGLVLPGGVMTYSILSILGMYGYMKFKKNRPNGYIFGRLYRLGLYEARSINGLNLKRILTKKEKKFKVLPYGFITSMRGN